mgnify:CR=1 FL=1
MACYGISFTGEVQGSMKITELIKSIKPKYLIAGHYHHRIGPQDIEATKYSGLNILIPPLRKDKLGCVQQGSIAILDTAEDTIEFINDSWFTRIYRDFDFTKFIQELKESGNLESI